MRYFYFISFLFFSFTLKAQTDSLQLELKELKVEFDSLKKIVFDKTIPFEEKKQVGKRYSILLTRIAQINSYLANPPKPSLFDQKQFLKLTDGLQYHLIASRIYYDSLKTIALSNEVKGNIREEAIYLLAQSSDPENILFLLNHMDKLVWYDDPDYVNAESDFNALKVVNTLLVNPGQHDKWFLLSSTLASLDYPKDNWHISLYGLLFQELILKDVFDKKAFLTILINTSSGTRRENLSKIKKAYFYD